MANPQAYVWPVAAAAAIAALQDTAGAATLKLDGSLSLSTNNGLFVDLGSANRVVTLTSANDLHLVNVTITGTLNGVVVSEERVGPTSNTVATTQVFSTITKITVDAAVTAISVGTGTTGYTDWWAYNPLCAFAGASCQVIATATVSYSLQVTCDDVQTNASPTVFTPVTSLTTASTSILAAITPLPITYARIAMLSSNSTGALVATFTQQGIR